MEKNLETIVLGGGCFWCLEAVFGHVRGVEKIVSGYAGGSADSPSYEQVSNGKTGHAEVVQISFHPGVISLADILHIFFSIHDPTTPDRQGADIGTQYRSVVLYHGSAQRGVARKSIKELGGAGIFGGAIVTQVEELKEFFPAEEYHQKYFEKNPDNAYCQLVVAPKVSKFREKYRQFFK